MLLTQLFIDFVLKCLQLLRFIVATWYIFRLALTMCGANLDEVLDVVIIHII